MSSHHLGTWDEMLISVTVGTLKCYCICSWHSVYLGLKECSWDWGLSSVVEHFPSKHRPWFSPQLWGQGVGGDGAHYSFFLALLAQGPYDAFGFHLCFRHQWRTESANYAPWVWIFRIVLSTVKAQNIPQVQWDSELMAENYSSIRYLPLKIQR